MKVNIIKKNGKKYIGEEEILSTYECTDRGVIVFIRLPIFALMLYLFFRYIPEKELFSIGWFSLFIFLFVPLWAINRDIKNFYHEGFYITKKYFITFRGLKIPLEKIYFELGAGGMGWGVLALSFYENKSFIIHCIVKDNKEFNEFLSVLYKVSNNIQFKIDPITFDNNLFKVQQNRRHQLMKKGV